MKIARRYGGHEVHPIFDQRTCSISHLSEARRLISTVRQPSYNGRDRSRSVDFSNHQNASRTLALETRNQSPVLMMMMKMNDVILNL